MLWKNNNQRKLHHGDEHKGRENLFGYEMKVAAALKAKLKLYVVHFRVSAWIDLQFSNCNENLIFLSRRRGNLNSERQPPLRKRLKLFSVRFAARILAKSFHVFLSFHFSNISPTCETFPLHRRAEK